MRVQLHPADEGGCGYYRLRWPGEALAAAGHAVTLSEELRLLVPDHDPEDVRGVVTPEADVVVLQRPMQRRMVEAIPYLQAQGCAVVVEVDDDFPAAPPTNPAFWRMHPRNNPERNWHHLLAACRLADLVTVSTPALAKVYGGHGRVLVLPNCVPERYLKVEAPASANLLVGWTGSPHTHGGDLEVMDAAGLRSILARLGARFRAIGSADTLKVLGLEDLGHHVEWMDLSAYPHEVAKLTVGLVPLARNRFNEGKSWLKGLEYAALGVPFVASPTAEYQALRDRGAGIPATKPRDWASRVSMLLQSSAAREDFAGVGRRVAGELTVEGNAWRWLEAWEQAFDNRMEATLRKVPR